MILAPLSEQARSIARVSRATREARLSRGAAHHYPWIEADRWQPAALLADRVLAGQLLRGTHSVTCRRVLHEADFEFRGGAGRGGNRSAGRAPPEEPQKPG